MEREDFASSLNSSFESLDTTFNHSERNSIEMRVEDRVDIKEYCMNEKERDNSPIDHDVVSNGIGTSSTFEDDKHSGDDSVSKSRATKVLGPFVSKINFLDKGLFNVLNLGISFFLMFCSYETTQNFLTTIREEDGFVALFILYTMFAFASFLAPSFCQVVGEKISLIVASSGYVLFVFSAAFDSAALLYIASGFDGFCAAILWTAQASYVTKSATYSQNVKKKASSEQCSNEVELKETSVNNEVPIKNEILKVEPSGGSGELMGFYSGIFFALFQANYIVGNLLAGILISMNMSNFWIFIILGIICIGGCVTLFALRPLDSKYLIITNETNKDEVEQKKGLAKLKEQAKEFVYLVKGSIVVLFSKRMLLFSFISIYSGYSQGFFYGTLPPIMGKAMVGWVMIFFGVAQVVSALVSGKLNDFVGKRISMCMGLIIHAIAIAVSFQMIYWGQIYKPNGPNGIPTEVMFLHFITMGLFATGDAFLMNSIYSILGSKNYYKKKNTAEAFSAFRFVQAISSAICFIIPVFSPIFAIQLVLVISFLLCVAAYIILDAFVASVDKKHGLNRKPKKEPVTDDINSISV